MDAVEVSNEALGVTAFAPRQSLSVLARSGWQPTDPSEVVETSGTVADVLADVGEDPVKAQAALTAEQAGKNRSTLTTRLSDIAATTPDTQE